LSYLANTQTNKQTKTDKNITSLAEVISRFLYCFINKVLRSAHCKKKRAESNDLRRDLKNCLLKFLHFKQKMVLLRRKIWPNFIANACNSLYKKSELMLMRRARAYSSSCLQVILVYRYPFCRNSLFCSKKKRSRKNH